MLAVDLDPAAAGNQAGLNSVMQDCEAVVLTVQNVRAIVRGLLADLLIATAGRFKPDNVVICAEHAHERRHGPFDHFHKLLADDLGAAIHIWRGKCSCRVSDIERVRPGSIRRQLVIDTNALGALVIDHGA